MVTEQQLRNRGQANPQQQVIIDLRNDLNALQAQVNLLPNADTLKNIETGLDTRVLALRAEVKYLAKQLKSAETTWTKKTIKEYKPSFWSFLRK